MDIIALLNGLVEGIFAAEEEFLKEPGKFSEFETKVHRLFDKGALGFIEGTLTEMDQLICESAYRKLHYDIQRHDKRTLITTVGDAVFEQTLFRSREDGTYRYLLNEMLGLDPHERFSEAAEAEMIGEAVRTSYREAAKALPSGSKISKTTVMNKIHGITEILPEEKAEEKKQCRILYIDADEDHIAEQHGKGSREANGSFISRLAYVYEGKKEACAGRKELTGTHYIGGLYGGSEGVRRIWEDTWEYIRKNYDTAVLEKIYVSGDGAAWIKACEEYLPLSEFVLDKFHLMKYINRAAGQMLDEKDECRNELYRLIIGNHKKEFERYTELMAASAGNDGPVLELKTYVLNNWKAVQTAYHDRETAGCSAEGHVGHVFSDRMSSRPMGWSQRGADSMSRLRCFVRNSGEEKIIELVSYIRKQKCEAKTGTYGSEACKERFIRTNNDCYDQSRSYIDRLQATIPGLTAKKSFSISRQLRLI